MKVLCREIAAKLRRIETFTNCGYDVWKIKLNTLSMVCVFSKYGNMFGDFFFV